MALLFMDGFDHYATADIAKKWTSNASNSIAATAGRRGGGALSGYSGGSVALKVLPAAVSTIIVGFAFQFTALPTSPREFVWFSDTSAEQCCLVLNYDGTLSVLRGSNTGVLLGTSALALKAGSYNYIEFKATIHNTAGAFEVRVNGAAVLSATGVNTRAGTNNQANSVSVGWGGNTFTSLNTYYDDFYICDTSGSVNNDFLGDCRIDTLYPTSDGNYTAFTPSTGTTHYTLVDETAPNTTDYNSGVSVGDRDSYGYPDLPSSSATTILGVQVNAALLKDDAGARSAATFARYSSTDADGAGVALGTSQSYLSQVFETKPGGGAWDVTSVNGAEFGVKVAA